MTITVNFRVVGIYCYIPGYTFGELTSIDRNYPIDSGSTIKEVQERIERKYNEMHPNEKEFQIITDTYNDSQLTGFKYKYTNESILPPDATESRAEGDDDDIRTLKETATYAPGEDPETAKPREMRVWQYYVSAIMEKAESNRGGSNRIIIARDPVLKGKQPSHVNTALNKGLPTQVLQECGFHVTAYNLTWRLVTINLNDGAAQMKASRRRPTSGRIV